MNKAILDSGCTSTVCGEIWLQNMIDSLPDCDKKKVIENKSNKIFRFGDSKIINSTKKVKIPIWIANEKVTLNTEVINYNIPLLLSKESMKKAKVTIDFHNDSVSFFGKEMKISFTSTGHYCIDLSRENKLGDVDITLMCDEISNKDKSKIALKLHRQFGHPDNKKLKSLLSDAKINDENLNKAIDEISDKCESCLKYKRNKAKPVVGLPMARTFNETVAMDLKEYDHSKGIWLLHLIDHFTRYSQSCVIRTKKKEEIIKRIFEIWIRYFGPSKKFLSDNGGEFCNDEFISMCENLNIRICTTAAESPWSNGLVERHNAILGLTVNKIMNDLNCDLDVAVAWANSAKNSLKSVHGFSSNQLLFGYNPNFPNMLDNNLPALEGISCSNIVRENLNAMHIAREEFIKNESSSKIAKALKSQVRTHNDVRYKTGDLVYYKRGNDAWKGPGSVIGQEGQQILIKHSSTYIRVHPCNVKLKTDDTIPLCNIENSTEEDIENIPSLGIGQKHTTKILPLKNQEINFGNDVHESNDSCADTSELVESENILNDTFDELSNRPENNTLNDIPMAQNDVSLANNSIDCENVGEFLGNNEKPTIKNYVECVIKDSENVKQMQIISRAGKASGKYSSWYNIRDIDTGEITSMNWNDVQKWRPIEQEEALLSTDIVEDTDLKTSNAKIIELEKWKENKVYEVVPKLKQKSISLRWVMSSKIENGVEIMKGRLVAKGYQEDIDIFKDSPTCSKEGLRISLQVIASNNWKINSIDIKAAFLQSKPIEREVFVKPPPESSDVGMLWKLKKTIYGLCDGSRSWYLTLKDFLVNKTNCNCCTCDPAIFTWSRNNETKGILCCHVDDIIYGGSTEFIDQVIKPIKSKFQISSESQNAFKYIGLNIKQSENLITLDQNDYIQTIKSIDINTERKRMKDLPLTSDETDCLRSAIGQLGWISSNTRPDLAFDVCYLSGRVKNPTIKELIMANKVISKAKSENVTLHFGNEVKPRECVISGFHDASFGNLEDGGSQGGFMILIGDRKDKQRTPIMWQSRRVRRVVKSAMASETLTLVECSEACFWISQLTAEILGHKNELLPILCYTDSKQLYDATYSLRSIEDKRLRIDIAVIREMITKKEINQIIRIPSEDQLADCLTKLGASSSKLVTLLNRK